MDIILNSPSVKSQIRAISSKSEAHRYLICAALSDCMSEIICTDTNADIEATISCLAALGASITRKNNSLIVEPISKIPERPMLDCNESGSTLRFLLPLSCALNAEAGFIMRGRLASRPLSPLYELLESGGIKLSEQGKSPLFTCGRLSSGEYEIEANVSSQFISGLLFALAVCEGESSLKLTGKIESMPYIEMTLNSLCRFDADIEFESEQGIFKIKGKKKLTSSKIQNVGGDWSNAAFFLSAGAIGKKEITILGLEENSAQGDQRIIEILAKMGAQISQKCGNITVYPSKLCGIDIDASQIPDLVPILAVVASVAEGKTTIFNASRLKLKESDRIQSVCSMLNSLGANITPTDDGMVIWGKEKLVGGITDSFNDHRIAMSAAIASLICESSVKITNFEAINKSYPTFLENFEQ